MTKSNEYHVSLDWHTYEIDSSMLIFNCETKYELQSIITCASFPNLIRNIYSEALTFKGFLSN